MQIKRMCFVFINYQQHSLILSLSVILHIKKNELKQLINQNSI